MMNKALLLILCLILCLIVVDGALGEGYDQIVDQFYDGLAEIIEQNMNAPDACVEKVFDYYKQNEKTIKEIQEISQRYMMQARAMMDTYEWTEAEGPQIEALELEELKKGMTSPQDSPGAKRYVKAMEEFGSKHPSYAVKIAVKSSELAHSPTEP